MTDQERIARRVEFSNAVIQFLIGGYFVLDKWQKMHPGDRDPKNYPTYLPDFEQFMADMLIFGEEVLT